MQSMNSLRTLALSVVCLLPLGCRSPSESQSHDDEVPCTCGEALADLEGCAHPACLKGVRNPENPDCVCGSLSIPK